MINVVCFQAKYRRGGCGNENDWGTQTLFSPLRMQEIVGLQMPIIVGWQNRKM